MPESLPPPDSLSSRIARGAGTLAILSFATVVISFGQDPIMAQIAADCVLVTTLTTSAALGYYAATGK